MSSSEKSESEGEGLILQDIDEQRPRSSKRAKPTQDQEEHAVAVGVKPKRSKMKTTFIVIQRILFLLVWLVISVISLSFVDPGIDHETFVAVPDNEHEDLILRNYSGQTHMGLILQGPFKQSWTGAVDNDKYLTVCVVYIKPGAENAPTKLSREWKISLENKIIPFKTDMLSEEHVFDLSTAPENKHIFYRFQTNSDDVITVLAKIRYSPMEKQKGIYFGGFILVFLYSLIVSEIIDRTFAAMLASSLSITVLHILGTFPTVEELVSWVDLDTILLLLGMMILVGILSESGLFDYMTVLAYKVTKGRVWPLINMLCLFTALCSTFMDSVTMMLLVTPVTIKLCQIIELRPVPVLMCMVFYSNVGAAMTPVGDPPNVIITTNRFISSQGMDFLTFFLHMFPAVMLTIVQTYVQLRYLHYRKIDQIKIQKPAKQERREKKMKAWYRAGKKIEPISKEEANVQQTLLEKGNKLKSKLSKRDSLKNDGDDTTRSYEEVLTELHSRYFIRDYPLLYKSLFAFGIVAFLFCMHSVPFFHNIQLYWVSLLGALLLLIIADVKHVDTILRRVEWSTLLFFAALFILMEAVAKMGLIELIGNCVMDLIFMVEPEHRLTCAILIVLWVSAITSAFLDNIPVATMMVKIVIQLAQNTELNIPLHPLCWALALGACFGGNGTLIGASANVVAAGVAHQHGHKFTFMEFFLVGFPIMLGNTIMATIYLLIAHTLFSWH